MLEKVGFKGACVCKYMSVHVNTHVCMYIYTCVHVNTHGHIKVTEEVGSDAACFYLKQELIKMFE